MRPSPDRSVLMILCAALAALPAAADMGAISVHSDVTIEEPGQRAVIAHDGFEEILILETDLKAPGGTKALRFIPFPSEPAVSLAPAGCFERLGDILKRHQVKYLRQLKSRSGSSEGAPVEVLSHKTLGAHDITVVKIADAKHFGRWVNAYFEKRGLGGRKLTRDERRLVEDYVDRGFPYFVFDFVELGAEQTAIAPVVYRFPSRGYFYYPLQTSNLFGGRGSVELFVLCDRGMFHGRLRTPSSKDPKASSNRNPFFSWSLTATTALVNSAEMRGLAPEIAELMGARAVLTAFRYEGEMDFDTDIWLKVDTWLRPSKGIPDNRPAPVAADTGKPAYTPKRGSKERKAILDTLREFMYQHDTDEKILFVVTHLKVKDGWAYLDVLPQSEDGKNHYEDMTPLMRFKDGAWEIVSFPSHGHCCDAPREIFDQDR